MSVPDVPERCNQRSCLGLLYYNKKLLDSQRPATCIGLKKSQTAAIDIAQHREHQTSPEVSVPDFKFYCLGSSVYDVPNPDAPAPRDTAAAQDQSVDVAKHLPYCEGVEVLVLGAPEEGGEVVAPRSAASSSIPAPPQQRALPPRPAGAGDKLGEAAGAHSSSGRPTSRAAPLPSPRSEGGGFSWESFSESYNRVAQRNVERMKTSLNAAYGMTIKPLVDKILGEDSR